MQKLEMQQRETQAHEKQKKAVGLCPLWAERFGTWDVRPPETPKTCTEVRCFTPPGTVQNDLDKAPD
jgi:hypothetical protein